MLKEQLLLLVTTPVYLMVIGFEIFISHLHFKKYYTLRETLINIYLCSLNAGIDLIFRAVYVLILSLIYSYHFFTLEAYPPIYWPLLFVLQDLLFYLEHRVDHYCRLFWAVHITHHSSEEFNLTTGFRSSVLQPLYRFFYFIPLVISGFQPIDIVFMYSLTQIYGILLHTRYIHKMPSWFEYIFVTPSHHRVHHGSNVLYLDKNMGMVLIVWDKLFGTFQEELPAEPVIFGLTKKLDKPHNLSNIIFHEWKNLIRDIRKKVPLSTKLKYIFMPPGWSHDGSSKTADELRKELSTYI